MTNNSSTTQYLKLKADGVQRIHGKLLISNAADELPKAGVSTSHFLMALSYLELAVQNLKLTAIHLEQKDET